MSDVCANRDVRYNQVMISLLLYALLLAASDETAATQHRVDHLIERCAASKVVKLLASNGNDVSIHPLIVTREPNADENREFECVLRGMAKMPDLHFGFIGNAAEPNGS